MVRVKANKFVWQDFLAKVHIRPTIMLCKEPLAFFTCIYLAFQYAVFYIFLQSYPIIFEGLHICSKLYEIETDTVIDISGCNTGDKGLASSNLE